MGGAHYPTFIVRLRSVEGNIAGGRLLWERCGISRIEVKGLGKREEQLLS
jgi:hypothetical protein